MTTERAAAAAQRRDDSDGGKSGDRAGFADPAPAPFGTGAGTPNQAQIALARAQETGRGAEALGGALPVAVDDPHDNTARAGRIVVLVVGLCVIAALILWLL